MCADAALPRDRFRWAPAQPRMGTMTVEVALELEKLHLQIGGRPEERAVQAFPSNRANESLTNGCESGAYGSVMDPVFTKDSSKAQ